MLREVIAAEGPLPVDRYMSFCLAHPEHGYYMRRDPLGRGGDFTTAPEISQVFGELIGIWCVSAWQAMGAPAAFRLIELGPGRGTLMADLLRAAKVMPGFVESAEVHLVETSPALRRKQEQALAGSPAPVAWHDRLDDVPAGPSILIANEFFDALPVRQFIRTPSGFYERLVGIEGGRLAFGLAPAPGPERLLRDWASSAREGEVVEVSPARHDVANKIGERLAINGGTALIIDYGHLRPGPGDTLQAVRGHAFAGVLERPGECDLTSHVDFEALAGALETGGAAVHGPLTQGFFLSAMGLAERTEALKRRADMRGRIAVEAGARRLAAGAQMGHLFKVIAATHPDMPPPYPFAEAKP
jgi:SAM-dependent MidA family methyltransferase